MMVSRLALLLLLLAVGCGPRPTPKMPVGTHGPAGDSVSPEPEHQRLLALTTPSPMEQAQLMLWEACQSRGNERSGTDFAQIEFSPGVSYPVQAEWQFDQECTQLTLKVKWDPRIRVDNDIHVAVSRVLNYGFWRELDSFYFLHFAVQHGWAAQPMKSVNSAAIFYCSARKLSANEMLIKSSIRQPVNALRP